jgi:hypothetical protein
MTHRPFCQLPRAESKGITSDRSFKWRIHHKESSISTTTLPSTHLADTLTHVLCQRDMGAITATFSYLVRSFTIKSGTAPDAAIWSRVCEVHTASVRAPAARPASNPDGASSTTRPARVESVLNRVSPVITYDSRARLTYSFSGLPRRAPRRQGMDLASACRP